MTSMQLLRMIFEGKRSGHSNDYAFLSMGHIQQRDELLKQGLLQRLPRVHGLSEYCITEKGISALGTNDSLTQGTQWNR